MAKIASKPVHIIRRQTKSWKLANNNNNNNKVKKSCKIIYPRNTVSFRYIQVILGLQQFTKKTVLKP